MKVVVYSHDADTRAEIKLAIGRRPAPDVPEAEIVEVATEPALFRLLDAGGVDVMVLDGEAQPAGGMGVSRQAKDEIYNCPPVLLVIARADDRWLATWSRAEAVVSHPIDPVALARELAALMRSRAASASGSRRSTPRTSAPIVAVSGSTSIIRPSPDGGLTIGRTPRAHRAGYFAGYGLTASSRPAPRDATGRAG
jgi:DNA-binding response OmpR family regulator